MNFLHTLANKATEALTSPIGTYVDFKQEHSFEKRQEECNRITHKYPDRLPIICQRAKNATSDCPVIDKKKYLVPSDLSVGQFIYVVRKRCNLNATKSIYFCVDGSIPATGKLLKSLHEECKEKDGFLYIYYNTENTFG